MRRTLICTGVLGGGTALTFAAAALAATLLPGGTVIPSSGFATNSARAGIEVPMPVPVQVSPTGGGGADGRLDVGVDVGVDMASPPTTEPTP